MNTKILVPAVLVTALTVAVAWTFAATGSSSSTGSNTSIKQWWTNFMKGMEWHRGGPMGRMGEELTDAEKTALSSMSDTEKQAFFEKKHTEMEAKRDAREAVIDKLLAGTSLTSEEETLRQDIIKERTEMKAKRAEMEANRSKIEAIIAKKNAGTALTSDEQTLLDSMPKMDNQGGRGRHMRDGMDSPDTSTAVTNQ